MKQYFIKPFESFKYCTDMDSKPSDMWRMALKDPAYILIICSLIAFISYNIF